MSFLKKMWLCILSQRGEEEGEAASGSGEASVEGQGEQQAVAEGQSGEKPAVSLEELQRQVDEYKSKHETLSGQSRATERNLAATRRALESSGFRLLTDSDGNVQLVPAAKQTQNSRFTDEHKNKFFSYFPDAKAGEEFLNIQRLLIEDMLDSGLKGFKGEMTKEQQFSSQRQDSINRMYQLFPQLDSKDKGFNKEFYDKADRILIDRYLDPKTGQPLIAHADLIAANEAAIELGISPASVVKAKAEAFEKGKESKQIVGTVKSSQAQGGGGGFKKLAFAEYSKLSQEQRAEYDKNDIQTRKVK